VRPVRRSRSGRRVRAGARWAYAEYALADVVDLLPKPAALPWDVAASVAISGETAYRTLGLLGVIGPGGTLLVHGASGGVGALARSSRCSAGRG
jgi:NADPH:quinone reductase-like Zn-dependent oxidoreductase